MEAVILSNTFENKGVIDDYESFIWTDRYSEAGEFEICTYPNSEIVSIAQKGYYVYLKDSEHAMVIESINLTTDVENGDRLIISGRSLESLLMRRIIWGLTSVSGTVEACIHSLLYKNVTNASNSRRITNFRYITASGGSPLPSTTMQAQYTGDNLYETIQYLCDLFDIGFKVTLDDNNIFTFQLYNGVDHSYNQSTNPYVVFSPDYENIINSNYLESDKDWYNAALIGGEDQGTDRRYTNITSGTISSPIERREIFVDARDIQSTDEDGNPISQSDYITLLQNRGKENLAEHPQIKAFEGDVETTKTYVYGVDYKLGDIVQIQNEYGYGTAMRVSEVVFSQDSNGIYTTPTFRTLSSNTSS